MTIGQLCFYDQVKLTLLSFPDYFQDNLVTHFTSSLAAVKHTKISKISTTSFS